MTDEALVGQCRAGGREKEAAFTELVVRYQKRIYIAARKMVKGDHDEADDIAQETFVKAYQAMESFRGDAQLYTWLYRIMMNAVIQRSRKSKVREMVGMEAIETHASSEIAPDQSMISNETTQLLEEAIETLPPKQQRVFMMRFYEELPYEEIAKIVGTSVGGLKANYFHAVRKIGDYLKARGQISMEFMAQTAAD